MFYSYCCALALHLFIDAFRVEIKETFSLRVGFWRPGFIAYADFYLIAGCGGKVRASATPSLRGQQNSRRWRTTFMFMTAWVFEVRHCPTLLNEIKVTKLKIYTEPQAGINILLCVRAFYNPLL